MPILNCSADNFDKESIVSFEIEFPQSQSERAFWLEYSLCLNVGSKSYSFRSLSRKVQTALGTEGEIGKFAFSLSPTNELELWILGLRNFLKDDSMQSFRFEPADPSFEFEVSRIMEQFKVYIWVDAGNSSQLAYTWDALGIRFVTDLANLQSFVEELEGFRI